jgi:hypothetical protein
MIVDMITDTPMYQPYLQRIPSVIQGVPQPHVVLPHDQRGDIFAVVLPRTSILHRPHAQPRSHAATPSQPSFETHPLASSHRGISPVVSNISGACYPVMPHRVQRHRTWALLVTGPQCHQLSSIGQVCAALPQRTCACRGYGIQHCGVEIKRLGSGDGWSRIRLAFQMNALSVSCLDRVGGAHLVELE